APAHEVAEDILEDIRHRGGELRPETGRAAPATILEGSVTEAVIGSALLGVLQRVIRLIDFLELVLGFRIARIAVGVELHRELAVSAFELCLVGPTLNAEHLVEIPFGQENSTPNGGSRPRAPLQCPECMPLDEHRPHRPQGDMGSEQARCLATAADWGNNAAPFGLMRSQS